MIGIVVTGHGNFGSGLTSSVNLIAGNPAHYEYVDFLEDYSTDDLDRELRKAFDRLKECDGIIVMSDLPGGSPFKTAVMVAQDYENIEVIGGTNLPMICEITMARTMIDDMDALVDMALNTGKAQIVKFELKKADKAEASDGI
ncbi:PTS system N-acetylgalactosamine-specific IIA component [Breznakia sp. PF5-3]|uniref:PTS galactosamine/N-acetylgalactosamine transporter subunit IIA n=1 Tax=unclassified Breznakia TaxID=2623764 RepID=UPI0024071B82|nr:MULTISPECIES: PTS galactosamine/N-acetylgalactosamine transporter subunit IIA [unclassified Breznakia]MDL2276563.1 PTS sugar transporter subunit IIA [Breznakia sp. OttesenSCG-928-G09]MDF9825491.1 PTS system N-acetylgalactosamine-specific IIA component [Breznakia sp. PM6-1]MDF9836337.1 PTS system N-acetylgalactosamine-specific IIA component [Breznakia sp. PF5-3]MDF9838185.1 PTS system N-acetylgalactosamine-specific IIA component [Breznakia sp. PFB2-8]MDF9860222.1 PTS system N-acetylgalactosa